MSGSGPQLHSLNLWVVRETRCLSIIKRALSLLRQRHDLFKTEVDLNRLLYSCLLTASRDLYPEDEIAPIMECNNQPDLDDEARAKREQKRPDFQWIYLDRYESDPQRSSKQFVIECKRLGKALRADWILMPISVKFTRCFGLNLPLVPVKFTRGSERSDADGLIFTLSGPSVSMKNGFFSSILLSD